jgi:hypothetical protein
MAGTRMTVVRDARIMANGPTDAELRAQPTRHLLHSAFSDARELVKDEIALAKAELRADLKAELGMVKGLAVSALIALCVLNLLLVAVVLALAHVMPGWGAALVVGLVLTVGAAIIAALAWRKRVTTPLERTRRTLRDDLHWMKERRI